MTDALVLTAYVCWFVLCVAIQVPRIQRTGLQRRDLFHLLPQWSMFTQYNGLEFEFSLRYERHDATFTEWQPIEMIPDRPRWQALWHPQMMRRKMLVAFADGAARPQNEATREKILQSAQYSAVVGFLAARFRRPDVRAFQFAITAHARVARRGPLAFQFTSPLHPFV